LLGSGTFGKVFSARVKNSNKMIALKRVQQDKKYKTREMDIVKMLDSPFIIKILGTFVTDEGKYEYLNIAM
jgi:serine/threonine protein kinase